MNNLFNRSSYDSLHQTITNLNDYIKQDIFRQINYCTCTRAFKIISCVRNKLIMYHQMLNQITEIKSGDLIGRATAARRPIRKLPAPPKKTSQAHVVKLNTGPNEFRKQRSLPTWPGTPGKPVTSAKESGSSPKEIVTVSGRLSNFFRSVKLTK